LADSGLLRVKKTTPEDGLSDDFANKATVLPETLVIPINLAEEVSELSYE
jgi:hypothetical protein